MKQVIGLDIGGTKITGIVYDGKSAVRELTVVTPKNLHNFKQTLLKLVDFLSSGKQIAGIGVGLAGIVNAKGVVIYSPNMKFLDGYNIGKFFKDLNYKTVQIENDANCFALAEAYLGKGKAYKNFVGITLGTGLGGGIIFDKEIYRGAHHSAGEAGHIMADFKYDSEHYFQAARNKKDFKRMGEVVGILFANIVNLLDVDAIVLGGSVSIKHSASFLPAALKAARKHIVNKTILPKIVISNLKNSGSFGAALLLKNL
jgi:glucokinase